jgi:hypothetical protein
VLATYWAHLASLSHWETKHLSNIKDEVGIDKRQNFQFNRVTKVIDMLQKKRAFHEATQGEVHTLSGFFGLVIKAMRQVPYRVELGYNVMERIEYFVSPETSVVLTEEYNVMFNPLKTKRVFFR